MRAIASAAAAAVLGAWLAQAGAEPAVAPVNARSEAIRARVDELRYAQGFSIRGEHIILADAVAGIFEDRQFASAWANGTRLDHLIAALRDTTVCASRA